MDPIRYRQVSTEGEPVGPVHTVGSRTRITDELLPAGKVADALRKRSVELHRPRVDDIAVVGSQPNPGAHGGRQSVYSATPSSSTTRGFDPSGPLASVRYTARPDPVRQIDVVSVSPGNTGAEKRAATAVSRAA